ncbi:hypothetical protein C8J37_11630 [Rhizobium sp. PP-WC-1G-195]|nr:hypothetical protein C8J37_11630 [Rhizobium sp. PP-WC-1G-195]
MSKPSKNHYYVTLAQLRHISIDSKEKQVWVFDKEIERTWPSGIPAAGSVKNFNTVEHGAGKWNFEDLSNDVEDQSARLTRKASVRTVKSRGKG